MRVSIPRLPRLSLVHLMKLVAYCAVAMACVAPIARAELATRGSVWSTIVFGAVSVPLAWSGLSFVLVRRGPARDRLVLALLLGSVVTALGFGFVILCLMVISFRNRGGPPPSVLGITLGVVLVLIAAFVFLAGRLLGRSGTRRAPRDSSSGATPSPG